jgi:hypothetical protein
MLAITTRLIMTIGRVKGEAVVSILHSTHYLPIVRLLYSPGIKVDPIVKTTNLKK